MIEWISNHVFCFTAACITCQRVTRCAALLRRAGNQLQASRPSKVNIKGREIHRLTCAQNYACLQQIKLAIKYTRLQGNKTSERERQRQTFTALVIVTPIGGRPCRDYILFQWLWVHWLNFQNSFSSCISFFFYFTTTYKSWLTSELHH